MRLIGVLMGYAESDLEAPALFAAFRERLQKLGWMEGHNIRFDTRWGTVADAESMQRFAKELVALQPDVILATAHRPRPHCCNKRAPSQSFSRQSPIQSAAASSLASRGRGAMSPVSTMVGSLGGKWLELLKEIAPRVNRIAILFNPTSAPYAKYYLIAFKAAASSFAAEAIAAPVHDRSELETVITAHAREPNSGLIVIPDAFTVAYRVEIISLAARYGLPAIYPFRIFTEFGGLLSYGVDLTDNFRQAATYVDRILKGEKPSELPVQAPIKYELVINLKTAKALGLAVPLFLQQRADEVIE